MNRIPETAIGVFLGLLLFASALAIYHQLVVVPRQEAAHVASLRAEANRAMDMAFQLEGQMRQRALTMEELLRYHEEWRKAKKAMVELHGMWDDQEEEK